MYVIHKIGTDQFLPEPLGRMGRGGSHTEPVSYLKQEPRLFVNYRSAATALNQWLRGKHLPVMGGEHDDFSGRWIRYQEGTQVVHQPHRKREEMEILEVSVNVTY